MEFELLEFEFEFELELVLELERNPKLLLLLPDVVVLFPPPDPVLLLLLLFDPIIMTGLSLLPFALPPPFSEEIAEDEALEAVVK